MAVAGLPQEVRGDGGELPAARRTGREQPDSPAILPLTVTRTVLPSGGSGEVSWPETSAGTARAGLIWVYWVKSSRVAVASWSPVTGPTEAGSP